MVPSLLHARQHLLRPGAVLAPCKVHVVAAVAASATLGRLLRPPAAVCGGAVRTGALRQLAPRKVDCAVGGVQDLHLLTEPTVVLSVDFGEQELPLASSATTLLPCLLHPRRLAAWMAEQAGGAVAQDSAGSGDSRACGLASGAALCAVSWFEYEFPGGTLGSTTPHTQRSEHWQQVVQPLEGAAADAALAGLADAGADGPGVAALLLTAGYRVDRLWFELAGVAAAAGSEEDSEEEASAS